MGAHRIWSCTWAVAVTAVLLTAACSDDDGGDDAGAGDGDTSTTTEAAEPTGPAATVDGPLEGGNGVFIAEAALLTGDAVDLDEFGFVEEELSVSGTARLLRARRRRAARRRHLRPRRGRQRRLPHPGPRAPTGRGR